MRDQTNCQFPKLKQHNVNVNYRNCMEMNDRFVFLISIHLEVQMHEGGSHVKAWVKWKGTGGGGGGGGGWLPVMG